MSNRLITQVVSDVGFFSAIIANQTLNKLDRIIIYDSGDSSRVKVLGSNYIPLFLNSKWWIIDTDTYVDLDDDLDTSTKAAGTDYYVYACDDNGSLIFLLSEDSTYPSGYSASTSRKIGGFHTLCIDVGTISGHTLTGLTAESVLPDSVWDLKHRPICEPEGMVYCKGSNIWVDIYLTSGSGTSTASVYNGTITINSDWISHLENFRIVNKKMLTDLDFRAITVSSNQETNVPGGAQPTTAGGHSDTASRRMISDIGCEDCCGVVWQWLESSSCNLNDGTAAGWLSLGHSNGDFYTFGTTKSANTQLIAGGCWQHVATYSGTESRSAGEKRTSAPSYISSRGCCNPL